MKRSIGIFCLILCLFFSPLRIGAKNCAYANIVTAEENSVVFDVYDEEKNFLTQTTSAIVGDRFITKDFVMYEIYFVDYVKFFAYAKVEQDLQKPKLTRNPLNFQGINQNAKAIGLYCTHNAESYVIGDGYDSFYGKGGIHDITTLFAKELEFRGVSAVFDQSLHLPHDSGAYLRSSVTANNLLKNNELAAIFDCHRDGVSKSLYQTTNNGKNYSKIKIVVGQANSNYKQNLEFAIYLFSVAKELYPWLFAEIYMAKGHYNQALTNKALLFEIGTYLIEKEYVKNSLPFLADVVVTTLFETTVDEEGDLDVGGDVENLPSVDEYFTNKKSSSTFGAIFATMIVIFSTLFVVFGIYKLYNKKISK